MLSNGNGNNGALRWRTLLGPRPQADDLAAYQRLAMQLHYDLPRESQSRSVLLMSPAASGQCAAGALGLAASMQQELGKPVLLIDANPERPELSELLDCRDKQGWANLLRDGSLSLESFVVPESPFLFLPAGTPGLVSSPEEAGARLKSAQERFDFVLVYARSVLEDNSASALLPHAGCVLLLVAENETRMTDLKAAQEALYLCKARNVRIVLAKPSRARGNMLRRLQLRKEPQRQAFPRLVPE